MWQPLDWWSGPCLLPTPRPTLLSSPDTQLLGQLRNHQGSPPAQLLLKIEDVPKDVVPNVQYVLPLHPSS